LAESYFLSFGTPVTIVRPFNTYGPRQSQRAIIPTIISQALKSPTLKLGNLDPVRDLTFVTDTAAGFLAVLLALSKIPVAARALAAPGMPSRLLSPHSFRVAGVFFLFYLAFGHLPALFALPAGLGDIAVGIAAPLAARKLAQGTGRRATLWFNAFGITDLVVAGTLGALTGYQLLNVTPSAAPISELPLALVPTVTVPLLLALHVTSVITLARAPRPAPSAAGPLIPGVASA